MFCLLQDTSTIPTPLESYYYCLLRNKKTPRIQQAVGVTAGSERFSLLFSQCPQSAFQLCASSECASSAVSQRLHASSKSAFGVSSLLLFSCEKGLWVAGLEPGNSPPKSEVSQILSDVKMQKRMWTSTLRQTGTLAPSLQGCVPKPHQPCQSNTTWGLRFGDIGYCKVYCCLQPAPLKLPQAAAHQRRDVFNKPLHPDYCSR